MPPSTDPTPPSPRVRPPATPGALGRDPPKRTRGAAQTRSNAATGSPAGPRARDDRAPFTWNSFAKSRLSLYSSLLGHETSSTPPGLSTATDFIERLCLRGDVLDGPRTRPPRPRSRSPGGATCTMRRRTEHWPGMRRAFFAWSDGLLRDVPRQRHLPRCARVAPNRSLHRTRRPSTRFPAIHRAAK